MFLRSTHVVRMIEHMSNFYSLEAVDRGGETQKGELTKTSMMILN